MRTHDYARDFPTDWTFRPTQDQLDKLNELRDYWGLPILELEHLTKASQWFQACAEIDARADEADEAWSQTAGRGAE